MIHLYKIYVTTLIYKMFCYITEGIILIPSKFALDFLSVFVPGHIYICTRPSLKEEDSKEKRCCPRLCCQIRIMMELILIY